MITITGVQIKNALNKKRQARDMWLSQWDESLVIFAGDDKISPNDLATKVMQLEDEIVRLQVIQARYNLAVSVDAEGGSLTMAYCVKVVSAAGRMSKLWKEAAQGEKKDRYSSRLTNERDKDKEYAKPAISKAEALNRFESAEEFASSIREAVATGNTKPVEFEDSVGDLFR